MPTLQYNNNICMYIWPSTWMAALWAFAHFHTKANHTLCFLGRNSISSGFLLGEMFVCRAL